MNTYSKNEKNFKLFLVFRVNFDSDQNWSEKQDPNPKKIIRIHNTGFDLNPNPNWSEPFFPDPNPINHFWYWISETVGTGAEMIFTGTSVFWSVLFV